MDLAREVSELLKTRDGGDKAIEKMKDERYKRTIFWMDHEDDGWKIIHYTQLKGWQCQNNNYRHPPEEYVEKCYKYYISGITIESQCYCNLAYLWWNALSEAQKLIGVSN